jgi:hypothetical protein
VSSAELLLTPYVNQAWWIPQSIHLYANIRKIFFAGVFEVANGADADAYIAWSLVKDRNLLTAFYSNSEEIRIFNAIMELRSNFRTVVGATRSKTDQFLLFVKKVCF